MLFILHIIYVKRRSRFGIYNAELVYSSNKPHRQSNYNTKSDYSDEIKLVRIPKMTRCVSLVLHINLFFLATHVYHSPRMTHFVSYYLKS